MPNPDKTMFPGLTKTHLVAYYVRVAPRLLAHAARRPLSLVRHPDGVEAPGFFQKTPQAHYPDWMQSVTLPRRSKPEDTRTYSILEDSAGLVYLAGQGTIEFHGWMSRAATPRQPDRVVIDLDPPKEASAEDAWALARDAARMLMRLGAAVEVPMYLMATGSRGLHVVVPLAPGADFQVSRSVAERFAATMVRAAPRTFTRHLATDRRQGRLFLDTLRNIYGATSVLPYSLRARPEAPLAAPVFPAFLDDPEARASRYTLLDVDLVLDAPDPWASFNADRIDIEKLTERLDDAGL